MERERRESCDRGLSAYQRERPCRSAHVRHGARRHSRRGQCHRPPFAPVRLRRRGEWAASADAAVAAAARDVLVSVIATLPESAECVTNGIATPTPRMRRRSRRYRMARPRRTACALGQAAAAAIIALRANDRSDAPWVDFNYPQGTEPGEWRFTPDFPGQLAFAPNWGNVTPFVLNRGSQFRPPAPYHLRSTQVRGRLQRDQTIGGDDINTPSARTPDQTQIGLFWIESSPLAWNRLARAISVEQRSRSVGERAVVRATQPGDGRWLYRVVGSQVSLPLLAPDHRDSSGRHRRQSRYGRGSRLDAAAIRPIRCRITTPGTRCKAASRRRS